MDAPVSEFTLGANAIGSPGHMAPEQAEGRVAEITAATDVYGLGTVLCEMLSGRAPGAGFGGCGSVGVPVHRRMDVRKVLTWHGGALRMARA